MTSSKQTARKAGVRDQVAVMLSPYLMRRHRGQVAGWLDNLGVDPDTVSFDHPIRIKGSVVTYRALDTGARPADSQADGAAGSGANTVERSTRCTAPLPSVTVTPGNIRGA